MRKSDVFVDSFLDGFTMAGFLDRLHRPGSATSLFAPAPERPRTDGERAILAKTTPDDPGREIDEGAH